MSSRLIAPDPDEDDYAPSTPADARARLPDRNRKGVTRTELPNGTTLVSYDEPPLD